MMAKRPPSISKVVMADALHAEGIDYPCERGPRGADGLERYPDFTAEDPPTSTTVYWEHPCMLSNSADVQRWEKKLAWYKAVGMESSGPENDKGECLVTSENRQNVTIASAKIRKQVRNVFEL